MSNDEGYLAQLPGELSALKADMATRESDSGKVTADYQAEQASAQSATCFTTDDGSPTESHSMRPTSEYGYFNSRFRYCLRAVQPIRIGLVRSRPNWRHPLVTAVIDGG